MSSVIGPGLIVNLKMIKVYNVIKNKDGSNRPVSRNLLYIKFIEGGALDDN